MEGMDRRGVEVREEQGENKKAYQKSTELKLKRLLE